MTDPAVSSAWRQRQVAALRPRSACRRQGGFTLVELMVAAAVAIVLLAVAVPSFGSLIARMRIEGSAHNLATDLQLARTESVQRRAAVTLVTNSTGTGYTITSGTTTLKSVSFHNGLTFTSNVSIAFDPLRGLANAASLTSAHPSSPAQLRISSDALGRVQMCSPDGSFKGYAAC